DAAADLARDDGGIDAIACFTRSGRTADLLASRRPGVPILAFTPREASARRLAVRHAVVPVITRDATDTDDFLDLVLRGIAEHGLIPAGGRVVVTGASRSDLPTPNLLIVATVSGWPRPAAGDRTSVRKCPRP
ncbi:MAG: hypothetical protein FJ038_12610, partial [Chloroflexi bacterium]|nr:hypothetical protein [Chloroflexota bacterium]